MHSDRPELTPRDAAPTRAGFVALLGLPNAGKSTLLNALVGEHLSIATPKAQTTWQRVAGIRTHAACQMVFLDTPGIVTGPGLFHRSMALETGRAAGDSDVLIAVADGAAPMARDATGVLREYLTASSVPAALAVNKADLRRFNPKPATSLAERLKLPVFIVSARTGAGLGPLLAFIGSSLPQGPFLYPEDDIAAAPARFFVQELIRETVFEQYRQEVPYSVAVQVEEFREGENPVYIAASLHVERRSQKGLVIGKRGAGIRGLGSAAREKVEHFLGRPVYLDLWVKVSDGWRRRRKGLAMFGYTVPDDAP